VTHTYRCELYAPSLWYLRRCPTASRRINIIRRRGLVPACRHSARADPRRRLESRGQCPYSAGPPDSESGPHGHWRQPVCLAGPFPSLRRPAQLAGTALIEAGAAALSTARNGESSPQQRRFSYAISSKERAIEILHARGTRCPHGSGLLRERRLIRKPVMARTSWRKRPMAPPIYGIRRQGSTGICVYGPAIMPPTAQWVRKSIFR